MKTSQAAQDAGGSLSPLFSNFAGRTAPAAPLRAHITAATRRPEPECIAALIDGATLPPPAAKAAAGLARRLVEALRAKGSASGVKALIQEYSLSSDEGVALMCLAEALLRIPDRATRDLLIRDKLSVGDWQSHLGNSSSMFVTAATWGLVVTGRLLSPGRGLSAALTDLIVRCGEPIIRNAVDVVMRLMGEQFVTGQTIDEALDNSRRMEAKGFRYSYDMLGEAATTAEEAARYYADYERAIHAIGKAAQGRGIADGPGISIKLSALHPRYSRSQFSRVMQELAPRVRGLALIAKSYNIGLNIDAEEADRLEISLDLLEALAFDPDLAGWDGIGFVVQAYGKRCPFVIDYLIDLGRRSHHRLMVRLVKGAYWDSEIKKAQVDGHEDFPVYTRKIHTDVAYIACARKLLAARDAVFPQFATHNAQTLATIITLGGEPYDPSHYEFQCLHGMGEALYEEVVGADKLNRPCRIYAPVGTHETLLAYLVRRLLENGANSSFVNRIADADLSIEDLITDPAAAARKIMPLGAPHAHIALPRALFGSQRMNSAGLDLANERVLSKLGEDLSRSTSAHWDAAPAGGGTTENGGSQVVLNPADHRDIIGHVVQAGPGDIERAFAESLVAGPRWAATSPATRAAILARAADLLQEQMPLLLGLIVREAGKSLANAVGEVREAVDFLRYYGAEAIRTLSQEAAPLGPVVCISPWNFPLAIFTGQIAAALASGNCVLAKPAEETPLIAAEAVRILHQAGVPADVLHFLPGEGDVGAALVAHAACRGVMFTGSTEVARSIQRRLAERLSPQGRPIPLIAETGGQNAMIVDSSALAEQVVGDVISSAFDSAGQRCSALRVLCVQEDVADRILAMLKGAMRELKVGRPDALSVDVGPVITATALKGIAQHIDAMRAAGCRIFQTPLDAEGRNGTFVPPTLIELAEIGQLKREVFGPVLHVVRYRRETLDHLIDVINATGYGLTFGLHTRLDECVDRVLARIKAGNVYINRNIIGAVVGVQPFGGRALSGTGPKAGGPLYMRRMLSAPPQDLPVAPGIAPAAVNIYCDWLESMKRSNAAIRVRAAAARSALGYHAELPGPVGELNAYELHPRGQVLLLPASEAGLLLQIGAVLATGNDILLPLGVPGAAVLKSLPEILSKRIAVVGDWTRAGKPAAALVEGGEATLRAAGEQIAALAGPVIPVQGLSSEALAQGTDYDLEWLLEERSVSINTTAAGGNASLMTLQG